MALTLALIVAGALAGAGCGVLALAPAWIASRLHPTPDGNFIVWFEATVWAATVGGVLGAFLGPTLALSLLRRCPLWRVLLEPAVGTVVGSLIAWPLAYYRWCPAFQHSRSAVFSGRCSPLFDFGGQRSLAKAPSRTRYLTGAEAGERSLLNCGACGATLLETLAA
jgi:hypothetical protein